MTEKPGLFRTWRSLLLAVVIVTGMWFGFFKLMDWIFN